MKRYGNLYEKIYSMDNLILAHNNAKKGKGWYEEVQEVENNLEYYLTELQQMLINKTYQTSEYIIFERNDGKKVREIYKLPYFPDRICQWAIMQVIEPILIKKFTKDTYSAIPNKGIHDAKINLENAINNDFNNSQYTLKLDISKYYPNINHDILKSMYKKIFKDKDLLWLIDEIIDSIKSGIGVPIGNYLSQYSGNIYLAWFDHWIKEVLKIKHYFRYMDDITIIHKSKEFLRILKLKIEEYLNNLLELKIKKNWQIFPTNIRGIDFVGFRFFYGFTLLRKSIAKNLKRKCLDIKRKIKNGIELTKTDWFCINSYKGWIKWCNGNRLYNKYIAPLEDFLYEFYINNIKGKNKSSKIRRYFMLSIKYDTCNISYI